MGLRGLCEHDGRMTKSTRTRRSTRSFRTFLRRQERLWEGLTTPTRR